MVMARTRSYDLMELIRRKSSMSADIVSKKDPEYQWYAGANFETASKIAVVDTMLKNGLIPKDMVVFVKLYRNYLQQQRKAFFASVGCTEITKLGFILGDTSVVKKATAPATY